MPNAFLPQLGHYEELIAYKKAECIYDVTYFFVNHYLSRGDRTVDQMLQAARRTLWRAVRRQRHRERLKLSCTMWPRPVCRSCWPTMLTICVCATLNCGTRNRQRLCRRGGCAGSTLTRLSTVSGWRGARPGLLLTLPLCSSTRLTICWPGLSMPPRNDSWRKGGIREQMTRARLEYRKGKRG